MRIQIAILFIFLNNPCPLPYPIFLPPSPLLFPKYLTPSATYMLVVNRDEGRTHVQASFPAGQYHDYPSLTQAHTVAFLGNLFPGIPPMQILHHYWIRQYASE